jgi:hypothetical protein
MKKEINEDIETLKNNQSEINNSIFPLKSQKTLLNRVKQVENRVLDTEEETTVRQKDSRKKKMLFSKQTTKQRIGKIKQ